MRCASRFLVTSLSPYAWDPNRGPGEKRLCSLGFYGALEICILLLLLLLLLLVEDENINTAAVSVGL